MKPERSAIGNFHDYDSMSDEELNVLVDEALAAREARIRHRARMREAEEHAIKIYDAIYEAQQNGFTVRINNEIVDNDSDVEVEP